MDRYLRDLICQCSCLTPRRLAHYLAYGTFIALVTWSAIAGAQRRETCLSDVYIALDRSGSMSSRLEDGTNRRMMDVASEAIASIANTYQHQMDLGLAMFPAGGTDCIVGRQPFVPVGAGNGPAFVEQLQRHRYTTGQTPLARAIVSYTRWLIDERMGPERQAIILVTDGNESCGGNPVRAAADALTAGVRVYVVAIVSPGEDTDRFDAIAMSGGTGSAVAINDVRELRRTLSSLLRTIGAERCNNFDDDCDGRIDEGLGRGERCDTGRLGVCAEGVQMCTDGGVECVPSAQAALEVCDGLDNDCDGRTDENVPGVGRGCSTGAAGVCGPGQTRCVDGAILCIRHEDPSREICDGADNDCDGRADEDNPGGGGACDTGSLGACGVGSLMCSGGEVTCTPDVRPTSDVCDGIDNDCDGRLDEADPSQGQTCSTGLPGACGIGETICVDGGLLCGSEARPRDEVCDGVDNDCDGTVDESFPEDGQRCGTGEPGVCAWSSFRCVDGALVCPFDGDVGKDTCDGTDDDCDGRIDEDVRNECGWCGHPPTEVCNGSDEDCDGQIDEAASCPDELVCRFGRCVDACEHNECPDGYQCEGGLCLTACEIDECDDGLDCRDGECVEPCDDIDCGEGAACVDGTCSELAACDDDYCALGDRCEGGTCRRDPCLDVVCEGATFCREGQCVDSCAMISCAAGESCFDGSCEPDDCSLLDCDEGFVCFDGRCERELCDAIECDHGEICLRGRCETSPCAGVVCPNGQECQVRQETAQCVFSGVEQPESHADHVLPVGQQRAAVSGEAPPSPVAPAALEREDVGSSTAYASDSGCDCDASGSGGSSSALAALMLILLGARRFTSSARR